MLHFSRLCKLRYPRIYQMRCCGNRKGSGFACSISLATALWVTHVSFGLAERALDPGQEFDQLQQELVNRGFQVRLQLPPQTGAYGLLEPSTRTIWIHPVVFELGIALPVLVHEGVHAAQVCEGEGIVASLNLDIEPPNVTRPLFLRYHTYRRQIESEAYAVQVQPNAYERVMTLLEKHC